MLLIHHLASSVSFCCCCCCCFIVAVSLLFFQNKQNGSYTMRRTIFTQSLPSSPIRLCTFWPSIQLMVSTTKWTKSNKPLNGCLFLSVAFWATICMEFFGRALNSQKVAIYKNIHHFLVPWILITYITYLSFLLLFFFIWKCAKDKTKKIFATKFLAIIHALKFNVK